MSSKPLKTAGALRAGDTEFLHSDMRRERQTVPVEVLIQAMDHPDRLAALGWSVEDARAAVDAARKPKPSPVQAAALRAANNLEREDLLRHVTFPDSFKGDCAEIIAYEFAFVDELVECLKSVKRAYRDPVCINFEKFNEVMDSASDLLERIEKGIK